MGGRVVRATAARRRGLLLGAVLLALGLGAQPGTTALAVTRDLGSLLADPPSASYTQIPETEGSSSLHLGALDATAVADGWAGTTGDLASEGFNRGYQKAWKSSGAVYSAEVDEFNTAKGAKDHVEKARTSTKITITTYKADLATPGIPDSYGYTGESSSGSEKQLQIFFARGNLVFDIGFYASSTPSSSTALAQAKKQYDKAPADSSSSPGSGGGAGTTAASNAGAVVGIILGLGGLLCVLLVIGLIIFFVVRSRRGRAMPPPPPPPVGAVTPPPPLPPAAVAPVIPPTSPAVPPPLPDETMIQPVATPAPVPPPPSAAAPPLQLSPDRHFWWDGSTWQDATQVRPPGVPVSPDGTMWHDGLSWRHNPQ